jgi:hypothetical protein
MSGEVGLEKRLGVGRQRPCAGSSSNTSHRPHRCRVLPAAGFSLAVLRVMLGLEGATRDGPERGQNEVIVSMRGKWLVTAGLA